MPEKRRGGGDPAREGRDLHEADVVKQLQAGGATVVDQQKTVELSQLAPVIKVVGHIDGWISLLSSGRVLEVKSLGKTEFKRMQSLGIVEWLKHKPDYAWQISGAMVATGAGAFYVCKSRDSGEIVTQDIDAPFVSEQQIVERLQKLELWAAREDWPECEKDGWCWAGPYRHVHFVERDGAEPTPFTKLKDQKIEQLAERLYDVRRKRKAAEELEADLKEELLGIIEPGAYETERLIVRVIEKPTRRIDSKKVREDHGQVYDVVGKSVQVNVDPRG